MFKVHNSDFNEVKLATFRNRSDSSDAGGVRRILSLNVQFIDVYWFRTDYS